MKYLGMYQFSKSDNFMKGKSRFTRDKKVADTILTNIKEASVWGGELDMEDSKYTEIENSMPKVVGGIGEKKSNGGTQYYEQDRIYDDKIATTIPAEKSFHPFYKTNLRIRKLTPCECIKLMGFEKEDYESMVKAGLSDSAIYHCAGDSIIVSVLMSIFGNLLEIDTKDKITKYVERLVDNH